MPEGTGTGGGQQAGAPAPATSQPPTGKDWQKEAENNLKRYQGASQVISARDTQITELKAQLEGVNKANAEWEGRLAALQAEHDAKVSTITESLTNTSTTLADLENKYTNASSELTKFNVLKKYPDLMPLADVIPAVPEEEQMERIIQQYADGLKSVVEEKTKQIASLAGVPPQPTGPTHKFSSQSEWESALNSTAGTNEFETVAKEYRAWFSSQGT